MPRFASTSFYTMKAAAGRGLDKSPLPRWGHQALRLLSSIGLNRFGRSLNRFVQVSRSVLFRNDLKGTCL